MSDQLRDGTRVIGERNHNAKLTADHVREIRKLHALGVLQHELARKFQVSRPTIRAIVRRETWAHVA
jgi:DNA-binding XRE family transcriptional regulator